MNKKIITIIISILLILSITDIVYLTSFHFNAFNERFHQKEFQKYNVYKQFPNNDINNINSELIQCLKGKKADYNKELFNENEINHLKDVKFLIQGMYIYYYSLLMLSISLILALFYLNKKNFKKNISIVLFSSGILTLLFVIAFLISIKLNFSGFFTFFHNIFFPQGGWLFSASDNIIKLYPSEFFYDIAKRIFTHIVIYGNILILGAILLYFYRK